MKFHISILKALCNSKLEPSYPKHFLQFPEMIHKLSVFILVLTVIMQALAAPHLHKWVGKKEPSYAGSGSGSPVVVVLPSLGLGGGNGNVGGHFGVSVGGSAGGFGGGFGNGGSYGHGSGALRPGFGFGGGYAPNSG